MNVGRMYILVMLIAGGLAGLAGSAQVPGHGEVPDRWDLGRNRVRRDHRCTAGPCQSVGRGRRRFAVRRVARRRSEHADRYRHPIDIVLVIQALIVLFIAAPPLVRSVFRLPETGGAGFMQTAKGWNA